MASFDCVAPEGPDVSVHTATKPIGPAGRKRKSGAHDARRLRAEMLGRSSRHGAALFVATMTLIAALARGVHVYAATPPGAAAAAAEALFVEGRRALHAGDAQLAAARLAESLRLDPAPGTVLNLAIAEERLGRLASAWEHARAARDQLLPADERSVIASELAATLERRIPFVTFVVASPLPDGTRVRIDAVELRDASFGVPLPLDPGAHRLVVDAPGCATRVVPLLLEEAAHLRVPLEAGPVVAPTPLVAPLGGDASTAPRWSSDVTGRASTARNGAHALLVGASTLLVATLATGAVAWERHALVERHCRGDLCDRKGYEAARQGNTFATVSTWTGVAAFAAAVGGGTILWIDGRRPRPSATTKGAVMPFTVQLTFGAIAFSGAF